MKLRHVLTCLFAFALGSLLAAVAHAQPAAAAPAFADADTSNFILHLFTSLAVKFPFVATLIALAGTMRLWAKPVFTAVHAIIDLTPTKLDDGYWAKAYGWFTGTTSGRFTAWLLDYVASIKLVPPGGKPVTVDTPPAS